MAAPDYVPIDETKRVRAYSSPPRRNDAWHADRPGDLDGPTPRGAQLGVAGPDSGYAYRLVTLFDDRLQLGGVDRKDAVAGCVELAIKRAALFGRAPVVHDLTAAFTIYGFLDHSPPTELSELRSKTFAQIRSAHHYTERREVVDAVSVAALKQSHEKIAEIYVADWTELFV